MAAYRMMKLPRKQWSHQAQSRRRLHADDQACVYCGMILRMPHQRAGVRYVHVIDGGSALLHPDDEQLYTSDNADLYWLPIGSSCASKIGLEWSIRLEEPMQERRYGRITPWTEENNAHAHE